MFKILHTKDILSNNSLEKADKQGSCFTKPNSPLNNLSFDFLLEAIQHFLTYKELFRFKALLGVFESFPEKVDCSLPTLAKWAGISLRTLERLLTKLHALGFINKEWRNKKTNLYFIHEVFTRPHIKNRLKRFFANVRNVFISSSLLFSTVTGSMENGGVLISKDIYLNKTLHTDRELPYEAQVEKQIKPKKYKERLMNKESMNLIEANLDKLPLTTRGILQLSCYPVSVVEWLLTKKLNIQANDIFSYLIGTAKRHATSLGIERVDFSLAEQMAISLKVHQEPYIDADLLEELKKNQQRENSKQSNKPKFMSNNNKQTIGSVKTAVNPTAWPTLESYFEKMKKKAIIQAVYVEGMSFGDIQDVLRKNYEKQFSHEQHVD